MAMRRWLAPTELAPWPMLLLVLAAIAVAVGGYEHAHLYHDGYREIDTIGTLFLLNAIGSLATILALAAQRPVVFVAGSLAISVGSVVALVLTRTTGLFGFEEAGYDGAAMVSLLAEIAAVALTLGGAIAAGRTLVAGRTDPLRSSLGAAARGVSAIVVTLVLGIAILGVGQGDDEPSTRGSGTTTASPERAVPPATTDGSAVSGEVVARGRALFSDRCAGCHRLADADATGRIGPDLDDVVPGRSVAQLREDLVDPGAETTPGFAAGRMPSFADLGDEQLDELIAYLRAVTAAP